jgi:antitoxin CptB
MAAEELNRLRWRCRRGLRELDLVPECFLDQHGERLQCERLSSMQTFQTLSDNETRDLVRGRTERSDAGLTEAVQWMRSCSDRTGTRCSKRFPQETSRFARGQLISTQQAIGDQAHDTVTRQVVGKDSIAKFQAIGG